VGRQCAVETEILDRKRKLREDKNMEIVFSKKNKNNVCDAIEGKKSFKKLSAEEWHQFVQNYNYDDGNEPFEWLIKQKTCDKGTALCLYWHLQPDYYCGKEKDYAEDEDFKLIKEIEKRYLEGFYETEQFSFDPTIEFLTSETDISCIPKVMQVKTKGILFERLDVEYAFLRNPNEKELETIHKKIKDAISIIQKTNPSFEDKEVEKTVIAIRDSVEYWKGKDLGKLKIENLSFLWLDCLRKKYHWDWIVWDWETGKAIGASNVSKSLTCMSATIIKHTISNFQPTKIISKLFNALGGIENIREMKQDSYSDIGLLFSTEHLKYQE